MGDEYILHFSPWGVVSQQSARITAKGFQKEQNYWDIMGVAILDYLDLYRKHTFVRRESYRLDYIGDVETSQSPEDIFGSDKKTIVIVCSVSYTHLTLPTSDLV